MTENYYRILGLDNFASVEEVRKAYRQLAKKYHPDRNPDKKDYEEKFKRINAAYRLLIDPNQKSLYDQKLRDEARPKPYHTARPRYAQKPYYTTKKREYTPTAWMYGKIFLVVFFMAIVLIPITLLYQSSKHHYERGIAYYEEGDVAGALLELNRAISLFGGRSVEAGIKATEIYLYHLHNYNQSIFFANRSLEYAEKEADLAYIYFLRANGQYGQREGERALADYQKARELHYNEDSLQLKLGFLHAFELNKFEDGEQNFDYLIKKNIKPELAWFGKGWCQHEQSKWAMAIESYDQALAIDDSNALINYYQAIAYLNLKDTLSACDGYKKAYQLGLVESGRQYLAICGDSLSLVQ